MELLESVSSAITIVGKLRELSKMVADADMKMLLADLSGELADTKLAAANLKADLAECKT